MTYQAALNLTTLATGFSLLLQGIENVFLVRDDAVRSIWSRLKSSWPVGLAAAEVLLAASLMIDPNTYSLAALLVTHLALCAGFGGSINGGSDAMTVIVLTGLLFAYAFVGRTFAHLGLLYIAAHLLVSYGRAGLAKLAQQDWRSGAALPEFLKMSFFADARRLGVALQQRPRVSQMLCWSAILFEIGLAGSFFFPVALPFAFALALAFHFLIFWAFGLNRFFWIWLSPWPSLFFLSSIVK